MFAGDAAVGLVQHRGRAGARNHDHPVGVADDRSVVSTATPPTSMLMPRAPRNSLRVPRIEVLREKTGNLSVARASTSRTAPWIDQAGDVALLLGGDGQDLAPVAEGGASGVDNEHMTRGCRPAPA